MVLCALHSESRHNWLWCVGSFVFNQFSTLLPKRNKITDISDLNSKDQTLLMKEIVYASKVMKKLFKTSKLNVEKIGNMVPQLHIHIIARNKKDSSWPLSVWVVKGKSYSKTALKVIVDKLRKALK